MAHFQKTHLEILFSSCLFEKWVVLHVYVADRYSITILVLKHQFSHSTQIHRPKRTSVKIRRKRQLMSARQGVYQFNKFVIYIHETCNTFALQLLNTSQTNKRYMSIKRVSGDSWQSCLGQIHFGFRHHCDNPVNTVLTSMQYITYVHVHKQTLISEMFRGNIERDAWHIVQTPCKATHTANVSERAITCIYSENVQMYGSLSNYE